MASMRRTSPFAIASITAGLLVFATANLQWSFWLTMLLSTTAIISGHIARSAIRSDPERSEGKMIASIGLVIGYIGVVAGVAAVLLLGAAFMSFGGR